MNSNVRSLLDEVTNTISVAILIYLVAVVLFASFDALGVDVSINPLFGILLPMGLVYIAFTYYHYETYE